MLLFECIHCDLDDICSFYLGYLSNNLDARSSSRRASVATPFFCLMSKYIFFTLVDRSNFSTRTFTGYHRFLATHKGEVGVSKKECQRKNISGEIKSLEKSHEKIKSWLCVSGNFFSQEFLALKFRPLISEFVFN